MPLSVIMDNLDDVAEPIKELYSEKDGKFHLTGIEGLQTQDNVARLERAIQNERNKTQEVRTKLDAWGDLKPDEVNKQLDRIKELEVAAAGKIDEQDKKVEELVEARVHSRLAPVEREREKLKRENEELAKANDHFKTQDRTRKIHDQLRGAADKLKVQSTAVGDVLRYDDVFELSDDGKAVTRENNFGIKPGLTPDMFLQDMQEKRPHWWPPNKGGGAGGSGSGDTTGSGNPWKHDSWNLSKQGQFVREHGMDKAKAAASAAGTTVGGQRPAKKSA